MQQPAAQTGIGLLTGATGEFDPVRGAALIAEAVESGDARAAAVAANLAAAGVCRPQDWNAALDLLALAAGRGWTPAQGQLRLLAGHDGQDWDALRREIDVASWTAPPPRRSLSDTPRIRALEGILEPAVCEWLIERSRPRLQRARVYDGVSGDAALVQSRTSTEADFDIVDSDLVLLLVRARIAAASALPPAVFELTKVIHYEPGQEFAEHFDFLDPAEPAFAGELAARGQRIATCLVYLNDDYEAGATEFPSIGLSHRGRRGDALLFANVDRDGAPDRLTLHAGRAPVRGEKWVLSQWIRNRTPAGR